jgi:DNA-binding NarL/FixJ family response regulator
VSVDPHRATAPSPPVVLIEDDTMVGQALIAWLEPELTRHGFVMLPLQADVHTVPHIEQPGVAICDLVLKGQQLSGEAAVAYLVERGWRVLLISGQAPPEQTLEAIRAGACGYVRKSADAAALVEAVAEVATAGYHLSGTLADFFYRDLRRRPLTGAAELSAADKDLLLAADQRVGWSPLRSAVYRDDAAVRAAVSRIFTAARLRREVQRLSERELDVVIAIGCDHLTAAQAAQRLHLSSKTINNHLRRIRAKYMETHPGINPSQQAAAQFLALELNLCGDRTAPD